MLAPEWDVVAGRSRNAVPAEAVRALAGVMHDRAAAKGIVATTAWFGKASWAFAHSHRPHGTHRRPPPQSPPPRSSTSASTRSCPQTPTPAGRHAASPDTNRSPMRGLLVGNFLVLLHQTIGRGIRGNELAHACWRCKPPGTTSQTNTQPVGGRPVRGAGNPIHASG
ncbi:restriction endonuclease [Streptomyces sp. NPDC004647]|uniref:restriction endonuclease n=1 Tax=Streptomyces sp. NPDC004647 TaxID=3154671 RepID=UPI0033B98454